MLETFSSKEYYHTMAAWLSARDIPMPEPEDLPKAGFVYSIAGVPTAVGFLRAIEGRQGKIDYVTSNPHQSPKDRAQAVQAVIEALIQLSKNLGLKQIYGHTKCANTKLRSLSLGFQEFPHSLVALDLRPKV